MQLMHQQAPLLGTSLYTPALADWSQYGHKNAAQVAQPRFLGHLAPESQCQGPSLPAAFPILLCL